MEGLEEILRGGYSAIHWSLTRLESATLLKREAGLYLCNLIHAITDTSGDGRHYEPISPIAFWRSMLDLAVTMPVFSLI